MSTGSVLTAIGLVVFGYLLGSVSPSVFLGRRLRGVDVRRHGSGNAGTTNAFRVLGSRVGTVVLIADIAKGVIPVLLARYLSGPLVVVLVAFACVGGHNYSLFLKGKGGKGVATGAGAAIAMMPLPMAVILGLYVVLLLSTRVVSIASITCTILLPVMAVLFRQPLEYIIVSCLMALVVLWAHRGNMVRLWRRQERRVSFPWSRTGDGHAGGSRKGTGRSAL
ncbi:MAG: glycerol-3-phosphate 1-O-acyltransferase PlsY [Thermoleophilia bacterium]